MILLSRRMIGFAMAVSVAIAVGGISAQAASDFHYTYVSLDASLPDGYNFFDPVAVIDKGTVYGNAYRCSPGGCLSWVAERRGKTITTLRQGAAVNANNHGVIIGSVLTSADPRNDTKRAALFRGRNLELIPRLPGETSSFGVDITDSGIALVNSQSDTGVSYYLRRPSGAATPLDFGPGGAFFIDVNSKGVASGTTFSSAASAYRGLRLRPPATLTELAPLSTETQAWALGINDRNEVLGYSFEFGATERIGFWRGTTFHTRFVEGTTAVPTVSNYLLWNERGLIVITDTTDATSYLVPRTNVRLDLAELADRLPPWTSIIDVNNNGDLVGFGGQVSGRIEESFLLKRQPGPAIHAATRATWSPAAPTMTQARQTAIRQGLLPKAAVESYRPGARKQRRAER